MAMGRTRDEHLAWAKERALEILDMGNVELAIISLLNDLNKHPELRNEVRIKFKGQDDFNLRSVIEALR